MDLKNTKNERNHSSSSSNLIVGFKKEVIDDCSPTLLIGTVTTIKTEPGAGIYERQEASDSADDTGGASIPIDSFKIDLASAKTESALYFNAYSDLFLQQEDDDDEETEPEQQQQPSSQEQPDKFYSIGEVKVFSTPPISLAPSSSSTSSSSARRITRRSKDKDIPFSVSEIKGYCCGICQQKCRTPSELSTHRNVAHGGKRSRCEDCGALFKYLQGLESHIKNNSCPMNPKKPKSRMDSSTSTVKGNMRYPCRLCPHIFHRAKELKLHCKYAHKGNRHKCNLCGALFQRQYGLTEHLRKTSCRLRNNNLPEDREEEGGEEEELALTTSTTQEESDSWRKHACTLCEKRFTQRTALRLHILTVHEGKKYECPKCGVSLSTPSCLNTHLRRKSCRITH